MAVFVGRERGLKERSWIETISFQESINNLEQEGARVTFSGLREGFVARTQRPSGVGDFTEGLWRKFPEIPVQAKYFRDGQRMIAFQ